MCGNNGVRNGDGGSSKADDSDKKRLEAYDSFAEELSIDNLPLSQV